MESNVKKLLHISDLHFGPPYLESAGEAILAQVEKNGYDVVVITGDLTQRARVAQFVRAAAFIKRLEAHTRVVVIPGNHDIPLFRAWERILSPYRLFHSLISKDRNVVLSLDDLTIVGLDSTHPLYRITNGRLGRKRLQFGAEALAKVSSPDVRKVIAIHHPIFFDTSTAVPGGLLEKFLDWGVDLVLSGHSHFHFAKTVTDGRGRSLVLSQCGTSTSSRGRGEEAGKNSVNEVMVGPESIRVRLFDFEPTESAFLYKSEKTFPLPKK